MFDSQFGVCLVQLRDRLDNLESLLVDLSATFQRIAQCVSHLDEVHGLQAHECAFFWSAVDLHGFVR